MTVAEKTPSSMWSDRPDPEVIRTYPQDYPDQDVVKTIAKFCFPFDVERVKHGHIGQNFTFVLTDADGKHSFGFCRLSSGSRSCVCLLSYLPWFEVFYKLLNLLAEYSTKGNESDSQELLESLHKRPVPEPETSVHLTVHAYFIAPDCRRLPSIPESRNLTEFLVAVDPLSMVHLYASLLWERRIIVTSNKLSTLTACVHGAAALLYPTYWQHVFIPVLPPHLLDYCGAPMPYLIGVHSTLMESVRALGLEEAVVLNVDANQLETPFNDLLSLPHDLASTLKSRIKKQSAVTGTGLAHAFLRAQAQLFGTYREALRFRPGEAITFSEEAFVESKSSSVRSFLKHATQLQLFKQFIDGRLELLNAGVGFSDLFEEEITLGGYSKGSAKSYQQWLLTVKKGGGAFMSLMTKANPAMKSMYRFMAKGRFGFKEVKSAHKHKDVVSDDEGDDGESAHRVRRHVSDVDARRDDTDTAHEEVAPLSSSYGGSSAVGRGLSQRRTSSRRPLASEVVEGGGPGSPPLSAGPQEEMDLLSEILASLDASLDPSLEPRPLTASRSLDDLLGAAGEEWRSSQTSLCGGRDDMAVLGICLPSSPRQPGPGNGHFFRSPTPPPPSEMRGGQGGEHGEEVRGGGALQSDEDEEEEEVDTSHLSSTSSTSSTSSPSPRRRAATTASCGNQHGGSLPSLLTDVAAATAASAATPPPSPLLLVRGDAARLSCPPPARSALPALPARSARSVALGTPGIAARRPPPLRTPLGASRHGRPGARARRGAAPALRAAGSSGQWAVMAVVRWWR
ncbi:DENN domain-containing protein 1B-like [Lethenteron reissneri]|uniref:DENN domain-containing protein 1B-like n=1 Tax=Lethenteron reissneri TaxID=7753 RepID=UPI002AB69104|nr:DENN domain-containing protein 1B-like [Lethenteron reissneri]